MGKYENLAKQIVKNVGGKDNIISVAHCVTRLRFNLKDEAIANDDVLKNMDGVVTVIKSGGQYQVVIGNHVPDVCKEVRQIAGIADDAPASANTKNMGIKERIFDLISGIMLPSIAILSASGIIKGLNTILTVTGVYGSDSSYYVLVNAIGDAMFYFFPVLIGYNTARKLGVNQFVGLLTGLILCYPDINGTPLALFGMEINATYTSTVLPVIFIVALEAPLERFLNKVIPDVIKSFFVPMLVLLISVPIGYMFIGPAANLLGEWIANIISNLVEFNPAIAGAVMGGFWQVFVMLGIHMVLLIPSITILISGSPDSFLSLIGPVSFAQTAVVFAIWLKTKDKKLKEIAFPAWITGIFGVTEPAIYGVTLPRVKMFVISCVGGAIGGMFTGMFNVMTYTMAGMGIFSFPGMINPVDGSMSSLINQLIAIGVAMVFSFVTAFILYKDDDKATAPTTKEAGTANKREQIATPISGNVISLDEINDSAFAEGLMGKGIAIEPTEGKVFAPCSGTVLTLFPTKHAIGIVSNDGAEVLIHVGMDTVKLDGKYFTSHIEQGQEVKQGDLLVSFDIEKIKASGFSLQTPIIITNTADYLDVVSLKKSGDVTKSGDDILTLVI